MINKGVINRNAAVVCLAFSICTASSLFAADEFPESITGPQNAAEHLSSVTLQAANPARGVAIFSDANAHNHLIKENQFLPDSNARLIGIYPGMVELLLEEQGGTVAFFVQTGDDVAERLARTRSALSPSTLQPSTSREGAADSAGAFPVQR